MKRGTEQNEQKIKEVFNKHNNKNKNRKLTIHEIVNNM